MVSNIEIGSIKIRVLSIYVRSIRRGLMASRLEERFQKLEKRLEDLEETVEILGDPDTMRDIREALDDIKTGRVKVYEDIHTYKAELGSPS